MTKNLWRKIPRIHLNKPHKNFGVSLLIVFALFSLACQPPVEENDNSAFGSKSANITPTPKIEMSEFESELKSLRTADYYYVFTLKRKDGEEFKSDDKKFVRENIHYATNRTSFIEDDKILFIGSNYRPTDENFTALKERFEFEDFSKPEEQIEKEKAEKKAEREKRLEKIKEANSGSKNENSEKE